MLADEEQARYIAPLIVLPAYFQGRFFPPFLLGGKWMPLVSGDGFTNRRRFQLLTKGNGGELHLCRVFRWRYFPFL